MLPVDMPLGNLGFIGEVSAEPGVSDSAGLTMPGGSPRGVGGTTIVWLRTGRLREGGMRWLFLSGLALRE